MTLLQNQLAIETRVIHAGQEPDPLTGAVVQPIYTSSTFAQDGIGKNKGYSYSRAANPTRATLEKCLASLESAGAAMAFPSGLSAAATVLELLSPGDHIVAHHDLYGGTHRMLTKIRNRSAGLNVEFVNFTDLEALDRAVTSDTKMLWFETPSNPLLEIVDIAEVAKIARASGALSVCDNTFSSPYCQRPLEMGIDIVVHSATKFLNGHSDLIAGVVALSEHIDEQIVEEMALLQKGVGAILDPISCHTLLRSLKTLAVRMDRHIENAGRIVSFLDENRSRLGIERLNYPGLPDHPGHEIAKRQMKGFGSLITFAVTGGIERANRIATGLNLFAFAVSLGGVEGLVQHPASMTHKSVPLELRERLGVTDNVLRLSVGIEHADDLIADLEGALTRSLLLK